MFMKSTRFSVSGLIVLAIFSSLAIAQENLPSLIKKIQPSVVSIIVYAKTGEAVKQGSGFFVNETGDVITNRHVLEGAFRAVVQTSDRNSYSISRVIAEDKEGDLVRVSVDVPKRVKPLPASARVPEVGERVLVIGSPLGLKQTVSEGIVSAVRSIGGFGEIIQITAPVSEGSSGSPVVDMNGQVIGVATFQVVEGQNLNFAVPGGRVSKMRPGISLAEWRSRALTDAAKKETPNAEAPRQEVAPSPVRAPTIAVSLFKNFSPSSLPEATTPFSEEFRYALVFRLKYSGGFHVLDQAVREPPQQSGLTLGSFMFEPWAKIGATGLVKGGYAIQGESLVVELTLFDVTQRMEIVRKRYTGTIRDYDSIMGRFVGEIILQYTGQQPVKIPSLEQPKKEASEY